MKTNIATTLFVIVLWIFGVSAVCAQDKTSDADSNGKKSTITVYAESGIFSSNVWTEVGETYEQRPSVQSYLKIEKELNSKVSICASFWNALSTKHNPGPGTELDTMGCLNIKPSSSVKVTFEAGAYNFPEGERIYPFRFRVGKTFKFSKNVDGEISNATNFYATNIQGIKGGVINKTGLTFSGSTKNEKLVWSVTPYFGIDNNLLRLGNGKAVAMGFLNARIDIPLSKKIGLFVNADLSSPIAGDTDRKFRKSVGVGLTFNIK